MSARGAPTFEVLSPIMAYSVCFYAVIMVIIGLTACDLSSALLTGKQNFLTNIFYSMMLLTMFIPLFSPIFAWLDLPKFVHYMAKWNKFQVLFLKVTRSPLSLNLKKLCTRCAVFCCSIGFAGILLHFFSPYFALWKIPGIYFLVALVNCFVAVWIISCNALSTAGTTLARNFKAEMKWNSYTAQTIAQYRIVWLRLSQLVSTLGTAMGKNACVFFALQLFIMTLSLYGFMFGITGEADVLVQSIGLGVGSWFQALSYCCVCNMAHKVTLKVKTEIQEELQLIVTSRESHDVQLEVNAFMRTIISNPPVISVNGFIDVNRDMLRAYASALVTYLIVLLQFSMGQPGNCEVNVPQNNGN